MTTKITTRDQAVEAMALGKCCRGICSDPHNCFKNTAGMSAALDALSALGLVLTTREPTDEMIRAATEAYDRVAEKSHGPDNRDAMRRAIIAAVRAAPDLSSREK